MPECPSPDNKCTSAGYLILLILMGFFYSCYAAVVWPCIAIVIEANAVGTAFGIGYCL
jgi:hypothetical protein